MRISVVLNPASGRGAGRRVAGVLGPMLEKQATRLPDGIDWQILRTDAPGHAAQLAREAASHGADVVVAAGGDGTVGDVVNGLMGVQARLALLPLGTGNDLARHLGVPRDPAAAIAVAVRGIDRPLDVGCVQGRHFVNIAGCGFDAAVADRVNRGFRHLRGGAAYLAAVAQCLLHLRPSEARLTLDGQAHDTRALLCAVANSRSYGGGMRVAPEAQVDDGLFDVCVVGDASRWEFVWAFPRVYRGTHTTHPKVRMHRARHVLLEADPPMLLFVDGEVTGTTPATFTMERHALMVRVPAAGGTQL